VSSSPLRINAIIVVKHRIVFADVIGIAPHGPDLLFLHGVSGIGGGEISCKN
jgi:hypothetical protein